MRLVQEADVVLCLGTRMGPFGMLPQYGIDYWPKEATLIQARARELWCKRRTESCADSPEGDRVRVPCTLPRG